MADSPTPKKDEFPLNDSIRGSTGNLRPNRSQTVTSKQFNTRQLQKIIESLRDELRVKNMNIT